MEMYLLAYGELAASDTYSMVTCTDNYNLDSDTDTGTRNIHEDCQKTWNGTVKRNSVPWLTNVFVKKQKMKKGSLVKEALN